MRFRRYEAGDFEAMYALDVVCFVPPFRFSRGTMRRFAEARKATVVVAGDAGELVGFCIVHAERVAGVRVGYVVTLDVAPDHRRKGLAGELMQRAEGLALEAGCAVMMLHVFTGNLAAIRFYERCGYERTGTDAGFYGTDSTGTSMDAFVYRKLLVRS